MPRLRLVGTSLIVIVTLLLTGPVPGWSQTQIHTANRGTSVTDSFHEYTGVNWGLNFGNPNGSGSRTFGGFQFGAPAIPPFGGYNPNSAARFGFGRTGNPGFHFGLTMSSGSNRSLVSNGVSTTSLNGIPSSIFSGSVRPFITGYTPIISGGGYYPNYGYPGYGYPGVGVPYRYPYAYQVSVHRHPGKSHSQLMRDAGHVGAHDHGHRHHGNQRLGGNHWIVRPIYGPGCAIPYRYPLYPTTCYPTGFYPGAYPYLPYAQTYVPSVGAWNSVSAANYYSDGFGNYSSTPMSGTLAAGILEAQIAAKQQWNQTDNSYQAPTQVYPTSTGVDPLGQPIIASENERQANAADQGSPSTATQAAPSLTEIRRRNAEKKRIEQELRHAAIERLMDASRQAYRDGDWDTAIEKAKTALERCTDEDESLKETIRRGIQKMEEKQAADANDPARLP